MDREFYPMKIATTTDGHVELLQDLGGGNEEGRIVEFCSGDEGKIVIPLYQIDQVIEWLQEAKAELSGQDAESKPWVFHPPSPNPPAGGIKQCVATEDAESKA